MATVTIEAPAEVTLRVKGQSLTVKPSEFCSAGHQKIWEYGLQRYVNDGASPPLYLDEKGEPVASKADSVGERPRADVEAEALALAEKKVAALVSGDFREKASAVPEDLRAARTILVKWGKANDVKVPKLKTMADADAFVASQDAISAKTFKARVAALVKANRADDLS